MKPSLSHFSDIHSHTLRGNDIITNLYPGDDITGNIGNVWYSIGIHPWHTNATPDELDKALSILANAATDPRVVAIGEAGLDAIRGADAETQERIFTAQIQIAERHQLPLIIHCVRRYGRLMELHKHLHPTTQWVIHSFRGKPELARQLSAQGIGISLTTPSQDIADVVPQKLLFHDSD